MITLVAHPARKTAPSETAITRHLRENARWYFSDLADCPVHLALRHQKQRPFAWIYQYEISSANHDHAVLVKASKGPWILRRDAPADGLERVERPRVAPPVELAEVFRFEHAALSAIHQQVVRLGDPRLGAVRVLDLLPSEGAIVMEWIERPTLSRLFLKVSRARWPRGPGSVETAFANAGAWLRFYHALPSLAHTGPRNTRRTDLVRSIRQFADYLAATEKTAFPLRVADAAEQLAADVLPERLPLGLGHGDYAPRNLLVGPGDQVAAIDTLGRWQVPIYEDLAFFLTALRGSRPQVYSRGLLFAPEVLGRHVEAFLRGYFQHDEIPRAAIRLYEVQAMLDKWSAAVCRCRQAAALYQPAARLRLEVQGRFCRRGIQRLLAELGVRTRSQVNPAIG